MNENRQTSNKDNNSIVEELEITMETIANLSKQVQKLAGKLSVLAQQCQDIDKLGIKLQSSTDKSMRLLKKLDHSNKIECIGYENTLREIDEIINEHPILDQIIGSNDKLHSLLNFKVIQRLKLIFHFISLCKEYHGYAYGGFVCNVLIPLMIMNNPIDIHSVNFQDVNIWFSNTQDYKNFFNIVVKLPYLKMELYAIYDGINYSNQDAFMNRCHQYSLYYAVGEKPVLINLFISEHLPVNDCDVNLLVYKPKEKDYGYTNMNWFRVEENIDGDSYKYSVNELIENIKNKRTNLLTGYSKFLLNGTDCHIKRLSDIQINRMKESGWHVK